MYKRPLRGWTKHLDFIMLDVICMHLGFILAYCIRHGFQMMPYRTREYALIAMILTLANVLVAIVFNTFTKVLYRGYLKEISATVKHVALIFALVSIYLFSAQVGSTYSRITIYLTGIFHLIFGYIGRILYKQIRKKKEVPARSMLIITTAADAKAAIKSIKQDISGEIYLIGIALMDGDNHEKKIDGVPVVADRDSVDQYVCREWVDEVFVRLPQDGMVSDNLFHNLREMGITIHIDATALRNLTGCEFVAEKIGESMVLTTSMKMAPVGQLMLKRLIDIIGGLVGCILTAIVAVFIAPAIWKQSPGPLFFAQERIGQNGKHFKMYKFRSMYLDAEERKKELMSQNRVTDGLMFKLDWDPRIIGNEILPDGTKKTGIGEFIRKTSLDEFPQFFNVLRGEMSLVGTRPPTVDEWEKYELHHRARLSTKPGITGMWQVSGRSEITDFDEITRLDTEYITNWNIGLDIKLLIKTVSAVMKQKGAM